MSNASAAFRASRPPEVVQIREPPPSAPVRSSRQDVINAMRGLDNRLNQNAKAKQDIMNAHYAGPGVRGSGAQRLGINPLGRLPEHAKVDYAAAGMQLVSDGETGVAPEAAEAYIARQAMVHGRGRLAPTSAGAGTKSGETSATWMTRAVKPVKF